MSNPLPESPADPGMLEEPAEQAAGAPPRVTTRRLGVGLLIIGLCWTFAGTAGSTTLLAAKIDLIDPTNKVFLFGLATALYAIVTTVTLFAWGVVSDQTRSRFGRRIPWIAFGATGGAIGLVLMGLSGSIGTLLASFILYGVLFSALPAALLATFPDRVPHLKRGTLSAAYGGGQVFGGAVAAIAASRFLAAPNGLYFGAAAIMALGGLLFVLVAPDNGNRHAVRARLDRSGLLAAFRFPTGAPDFYWAFVGRFLLLLGLSMVTNFTLYILTDYIGLSKKGAGDVIAVSGLVTLVTIVVSTVVAGPLSDRIKRRKPLILIASAFFAVGVTVPLVSPTATGMIVSAAICGFGLGGFLSVDAALLTEVLPSQKDGGKDLGILNLASTVPQVIAPLGTAAIVAVGGYAPVFVIALVIVVLGAVSIVRIKSVR